MALYDATLVAGLTVTIKEDGEGTVTKTFNGITSVGDIGDNGEFIEQSTLADTHKRYTAGMSDAPEGSFEFYRYMDDADQTAIIELAKAKKKVEVVITWADGEVATFDAFLNGYVISASEGASLKSASIAYRRDSEIAWS